MIAAMPRAVLPIATLSVSLAACSPNVPGDLGLRAQDQVKVGESPALLHVAAALEGGGDRTVADLLADEEPKFKAAPDPSDLFDAMYVEHKALPPLAEGDNLRVLTFNVGLLDRWYPFVTVGVPEVDARRARLAEMILSDGWDVLFLQEAWEHVDVQRFEAAAASRGYRVYGGSRQSHDQHGLVIIVREAIIDPVYREVIDEVDFDQQYEPEDFPGPGVRRGYITWRFRHATTGVDLRLVSTHIVSYNDRWFARDFEVRELGLAVRGAPAEEVVIVGGDFNAAPYYPHDSFGMVDGEPVTGWWRNSMMYPLMLHYGGMVDVHALAQPATDVSLMAMVPPYDEAGWAREPYGDRSWCEGQVNTTFSWDWCNELAFASGGETEYGARLDYLFLRDRQRQARVLESSLVYTDAVDFGEAGELPRSDHYGFAATLRIGKR